MSKCIETNENYIPKKDFNPKIATIFKQIAYLFCDTLTLMRLEVKAL